MVRIFSWFCQFLEHFIQRMLNLFYSHFLLLTCFHDMFDLCPRCVWLHLAPLRQLFMSFQNLLYIQLVSYQLSVDFEKKNIDLQSLTLFSPVSLQNPADHLPTLTPCFDDHHRQPTATPTSHPFPSSLLLLPHSPLPPCPHHRQHAVTASHLSGQSLPH